MLTVPGAEGCDQLVDDGEATLWMHTGTELETAFAKDEEYHEQRVQTRLDGHQQWEGRHQIPRLLDPAIVKFRVKGRITDSINQLTVEKIVQEDGGRYRGAKRTPVDFEPAMVGQLGRRGVLGQTRKSTRLKHSTSLQLQPHHRGNVTHTTHGLAL